MHEDFGSILSRSHGKKCAVQPTCLVAKHRLGDPEESESEESESEAASESKAEDSEAEDHFEPFARSGQKAGVFFFNGRGKQFVAVDSAVQVIGLFSWKLFVYT